jgi:hypothetical protein
MDLNLQVNVLPGFDSIKGVMNRTLPQPGPGESKTITLVGVAGKTGVQVPITVDIMNEDWPTEDDPNEAVKAGFIPALLVPVHFAEYMMADNHLDFDGVRFIRDMALPIRRLRLPIEAINGGDYPNTAADGVVISKCSFYSRETFQSLDAARPTKKALKTMKRILFAKKNQLSVQFHAIVFRYGKDNIELATLIQRPPKDASASEGSPEEAYEEGENRKMDTEPEQ